MLKARKDLFHLTELEIRCLTQANARPWDEDVIVSAACFVDRLPVLMVGEIGSFGSGRFAYEHLAATRRYHQQHQ